MKKQIMEALNSVESELIQFTQGLVRIKSYSGHEEEIVRFIAKKNE